MHPEQGSRSHPGSSRERGEIRASWERSREHGVDRHDLRPPYSAEAAADAQSRLARAACEVLDAVEEDLAGSPVTVMLGDHRGRVVRRTATEEEFTERLDAAFLAPGYDRSEHRVGTNALGTALRTRDVFAVHGDEHYSAPLHGFSGVAAPVRDPGTRRIVGVVDVTGPAGGTGAVHAALVRRVAATVEERLIDLGSPGQRDLLMRYLTTIRGPADAVVAISREALHATPVAMRVLGEVPHGDIWPVVEDALAGREVADVALRLPGRGTVGVRVEALLRSGRLVGAVGEVRRPRHAAPADPRQTGAPHPVPEYAGWSLSTRVAADALRRSAEDRVPVLLCGEPGTGKATMVRYVAARAFPGRNLVVLDAARVTAGRPAADLASELASELAHGSPVLVRHVEELPEEAWLPLVAAGNDPRGSGWLALSHTAEVAPGRPEDPAALRLVSLSPLRARPEDLDQALPRMLRRHGHADRSLLSDALVERLRREPWPTNFHGVDAVVSGLLERGRGQRVVDEQHLPATFGERRRRLSPIEWMTRTAIVQALQAHGGDKSLAAESLGMSRASIYRKIKLLRIGEDELDPTGDGG